MPMEGILPDRRQNESEHEIKMEEELSVLHSHFTEPNMIKDQSSESNFEHEGVAYQFNPNHKSESRLESL